MQYIKKFIGTKAFYMSVIALLVPMVIQQGITQFVNLLDNVDAIFITDDNEIHYSDNFLKNN